MDIERYEHVIKIFIKHQREQAESDLKDAEVMVFGNDFGLGNSKGRLSLLRELEKFIDAIKLAENVNNINKN